MELVLIYCMSSAPDRCTERREVLDRVSSSIECTMRAQNIAQAYLATHPTYQLRGWRCEKDKPRELPA